MDFPSQYRAALNASAWVGLVVPKGETLVRIEPYYQVLKFTGVTAGVIQTDVFTVDASSDFAAFSTCCSLISTGGTFPGSPVNNVLIQLRNQNTRQSYYDRALYAPLVFGSPGYPSLLPVPILFPRKTTIELEMNPAPTSSAGDYYFTLIGARLYYLSQG